MKEKNNNDKSSTVLIASVITMLLLVCLCLLPPFEVNNVHFRRANVLSSFFSINDYGEVTSDALPEYEEVMTEKIIPVIDTCRPPVEIDKGFEDYSPSGREMDGFISLLHEKSRSGKVRIAVLGDSFIEGDIVTAALRDSLQREFGGNGVGFVPFADPISKYRATVRQEFSGWTCYNILRRKNVPQKYQDEFFISGYVAVPSPGAKACFKAGSFKSRKITSTNALIFFKNRGKGTMLVSVNGAAAREYNLSPSDSVQCIEVCDSKIQTLDISVPVCEDFIGYGVSFEGETGVYVDNFGLRSSSGMQLLSTSREVNSQIAAFRSYDLVVLEYGLNVLQKTVTKYSMYQSKIENVIRRAGVDYPESAVLLLSIGDVGMKKDDGSVVTAPAVPAMVQTQRNAAKNCNVSFWNMYMQMGGSGSMKKFVDRRWANKDYTHINYRGGEEIAGFLLKSMQERDRI